MFSIRTGWELEETPLARALRQRRSSGLPLCDLTASNPTAIGLIYPAAALLAPLANPAVLSYEAAPFGILPAREAVAGYYRGHGAAVDPKQICLTTSTSEAYSYLFRLLCNPGDEVLIAQPSYPLFDFLAALDDVKLTAYPLFYEPGHGWQIEPDSLRSRITSRTRAIAVVHPNNPTGHFISGNDRALLEALCLENDLALIVDEVFLDYSLGPGTARSFAHGPHAVLTFVLSGLSKVAGLPQMKAAWIAIAGPDELASASLARLEVIADTFLSMNAPVQHALAAWIEGRSAIQGQILARTCANLARLDALLGGHRAVSRLVVEAGWYATLRVPAILSDEDIAIDLLRRGVAVHPGSSFGFPAAGYLIVSLLAPEAAFQRGIHLLLSGCESYV